MNTNIHKYRKLAILIMLIGWFSVLLQMFLSLRIGLNNGKSLAEGFIIYFGYFTILTNILIVMATTFSLISPNSLPGRFFSHFSVVTALAVAITLVGIVYHLFLRNIWDPQGIDNLADILLHYLIPGLYILYWVLVVNRPISWYAPFVWLIYPIAYLIYIFVRGEMIGIYPYPFIDVNELGYMQTAENVMFLLIGYLMIGMIFVTITNLKYRINN